jgi:hypothetical protein
LRPGLLIWKRGESVLDRFNKALLFLLLTSAFFLPSCVFLHSRSMPSLSVSERGEGDPIGRLIQSRDRLETALGRALLKLPDVKDGLSPAEQIAIQTIHRLTREANPAGRETLWVMARENRHTYQYSGSLQGLLWVVMNGHLDRLNLDQDGSRDFLDYAWKQLPVRFSTPEAILNFMATNFSYKPDTYTAVPPYLFFRNKYGDCTEFAMLAGLLLEKAGYRVQILLSRPTPFLGHASVIFQKEEALYLMDPSRTALVSIIEQRKAKGVYNLVDKRIYDEVAGFDRIFGPEMHVRNLVEQYRKSNAKPVPYRLIAFQDFVDFITVHHHEYHGWWAF